MDIKLLLVPGVALGRALFGWLENSLKDGKIELPEWKKLAETVIRMGVPMIALIWGLNVPIEYAAGAAILIDIAITKIYSAIKKK